MFHRAERPLGASRDYRPEMFGEHGDVADADELGSQSPDFAIRGDVGEDDRATVTECLERRDGLLLVTRREHEDARVGVEFRESLAGLIPEQDDTWCFRRCLSDSACIFARVIAVASEGESFHCAELSRVKAAMRSSGRFCSSSRAMLRT
jgi:hypothetical protein